MQTFYEEIYIPLLNLMRWKNEPNTAFPCFLRRIHIYDSHVGNFPIIIHIVHQIRSPSASCCVAFVVDCGEI